MTEDLVPELSYDSLQRLYVTAAHRLAYHTASSPALVCESERKVTLNTVSTTLELCAWVFQSDPRLTDRRRIESSIWYELSHVLYAVCQSKVARGFLDSDDLDYVFEAHTICHRRGVTDSNILYRLKNGKSDAK